MRSAMAHRRTSVTVRRIGVTGRQNSARTNRRSNHLGVPFQREGEPLAARGKSLPEYHSDAL